MASGSPVGQAALDGHTAFSAGFSDFLGQQSLRLGTSTDRSSTLCPWAHLEVPKAAVVLAVLRLSGPWQRYPPSPRPRASHLPQLLSALVSTAHGPQLVPVSSGVIAGDPEELLRGRHGWSLLWVLTPNLGPSFHFPGGSWRPQGAQRRIVPVAMVLAAHPEALPPPDSTPCRDRLPLPSLDPRVQSTCAGVPLGVSDADLRQARPGRPLSAEQLSSCQSVPYLLCNSQPPRLEGRAPRHIVQRSSVYSEAPGVGMEIRGSFSLLSATVPARRRLASFQRIQCNQSQQQSHSDVMRPFCGG